MADRRVTNLAELVVNYSIGVKKGDEVMINVPVAAEPLAMEIYGAVLKAGGHPLMLPNFEKQSETFYELAQDHHLDFLSPLKKHIYENVDCSISVLASSNTRRLSNVPPDKLARSAAASRELSQKMMERSSTGEFRWVGLPFPTSAMAQEANMSLTEYERFVYGACHADKDDPIAEWKKMSAKHDDMIKVLEKADVLEFHGEDTELKMSVKGRTWINCDGDKNMPDGEVFTGPIEDSVEGHIRFTFPGIYYGKEIENIRLDFEKGKVVKATAEKGEDLLNTLLEMEDGNRRLGEVAIGTNFGIRKFTRNILFDEKLGGTVHMAIGNGYPETGSKNRGSVHWDMIKDMKDGGEIIADGTTVYKNGKWVA